MPGCLRMLMWTCSSVKKNYRISKYRKSLCTARTFKHMCNSVIKNQVPAANDKNKKREGKIIRNLMANKLNQQPMKCCRTCGWNLHFRQNWKHSGTLTYSASVHHSEMFPTVLHKGHLRALSVQLISAPEAPHLFCCIWHLPTATPWQEKYPLQWHLPSPDRKEVEAAAGAAHAWGLKVWLGQKGEERERLFGVREITLYMVINRFC